MYVVPRKRAGLHGYGGGSMSIPVYSFVTGAPVFPKPLRGCGSRGLGCAGCSRQKSCAGLGDDYATPAEIYAASNVGSQPVPGQTVYGNSSSPTGAWGYGPSPSGDVVFYPAGPVAPSTYASAIPASVPAPSGGFNVQGLTNPFSYNTALVAGGAPSPTIGGLSTTTLLLGGAALLAVAILASKRR